MQHNHRRLNLYQIFILSIIHSWSGLENMSYILIFTTYDLPWNCKAAQNKSKLANACAALHSSKRSSKLKLIWYCFPLPETLSPGLGELSDWDKWINNKGIMLGGPRNTYCPSPYGSNGHSHRALVALPISWEVTGHRGLVATSETVT